MHEVPEHDHVTHAVAPVAPWKLPASQGMHAAIPPSEAYVPALHADGALGTLSSREQEVLRMRFGLEDGKPRTLEEIGDMFAVTRERVRQIEARALHKLRQPYRRLGSFG